tara:strand:+ start:7924 stop:9084 length:1161 start_codon:yes stop_codon:yes gene_type:complete
MEYFRYNQIVYLSSLPLKNLSKDFYVHELKNLKGLEVQFWNLTEVLFGLKTSEEKNNFEKNIGNHTQFKNEIKLQNNEKTLYITSIAFEYRSLLLYYFLKKHNCKTLFFARGALPQYKLIDKLNNLNFNRIIIFFKNRIAFLFKYLNIVNTFDYLLTSGLDGYKTIGVGSEIDLKKSKKYYINSIDKEIYDDANPELALDNNILVFIDEYMPFHPDFKLLNIDTVPESEYYNELNLFFSRIEKKLKMQVVICAHPKAENYKTKNYFENRKIYFNKTCEIIKLSRGVISHNSTAINFAVLSKKPIIFITSNLIKRFNPILDKQILLHSKILNSNFIDIDNYQQKNLFFWEINEVVYKSWKRKYLTYNVNQNKVKTLKLLKQIVVKGA